MKIYYVIGNPVKAAAPKYFGLFGQAEPTAITEKDILKSLMPKYPDQKFFLTEDEQAAKECANESAYSASGSGAIDPWIMLPVLEIQIRDEEKLKTAWKIYFKDNESQKLDGFYTPADNIGEIKSYSYQFRDQKVEVKLHQPRRSFNQ